MLPKTTNQNYKKIIQAIKYIDKNFKEQPSIETISSHVNMSKFYFIRVFKDYVGLTPIQFLQSITLNYAKDHLKQSSSILDSSLDIGLSSSSRLHDLFVKLIGVTPKEYKELGLNVDITYGYGSTPFGKAFIAFTKRGISFLAFTENNEDYIFNKFKQIWEKANLSKNNKQAQEYLNKIFIKNENLDLYIKGTNFQINTWKALLNIANQTINSNETLSLNSKNIDSILPCHKTLTESGAISGYTWRIEKENNSINSIL